MLSQDTFRAEWAWQILLAPERISGMVDSMLQDYKEGGWLPMWNNIVGESPLLTCHVTHRMTETTSRRDEHHGENAWCFG